MNISRRAFALWGMGAASFTVAPHLRAQTPSGHLTILVAQPAGGVTDIFARAVAPALGRGLGRVAVVENISGASGSIAANRLLAAVPDGSTLFVGSPSETVLAPLTLRAVRYKATDFRLLGVLNNSPLALYARSDLPANNLDELVALARKREGSGNRPLSYGSTGQGSLFHLVTEKLLSATGIQATHVPYRGGMPMLTDLQGGSIDLTMLPVDALLGSMVSGGRMKVLGVSSAQRLARFPAAATFDESRTAPSVGRPSIWVGLLVPAAMSESASAQMHKVVTDALGDADVRKAIDAAGGAVPSPMSLLEAAHFYSADTVKLQALAKAVHIQPL
ncbi:Tripartite-type tricarboxylate transporter, receptor component TctC [Polaromonas sp. OV174]|uniref:Bug family tripartite tricarboxylate transporter substrate binding protein n=1 Tax=Polaromonas sp. OV174 TaxID=1855300 RepID=UPI0008E271F5|nr:tripartite tricarboxylate transporter substrate binding protein [Polaromonas sp. OV174]SFC24961.1 Tripartite-type tricarboxylate transporter, receptor component TctC [Polaromonas sp. OV174]